MNDRLENLPHRVLFLVPYPLKNAPSQRFRFEQYLGLLSENGIGYKVQSFMDEGIWRILYKRGQWHKKFIAVFLGYMKRYIQLFTVFRYQIIFVHREVTPVGPPIYAWLLAKVLRKKIIFDFDDAIWIRNYSEGNRVFSIFKRYSNALLLMKWSWKNACGNEYLRNFAVQFNPDSFVIPTTVDTAYSHNQMRLSEPGILPVIGWTGSHSTLHYLRDLQPILNQLHHRYAFTTLVISDIAPDFTLPAMRFIPWNRTTEIRDLLGMDIGLMPLKPDRWSEGKCGLKIIQYMALGIVPVATSVGVNEIIVDDGVNGMLCATEQEWMDKLGLLLSNPELLQKLATKTREKVEQHYSSSSQSREFLRLFALK